MTKGQYESNPYTCKEKKMEIGNPVLGKKKNSKTIVSMIVKECIKRSNNSNAKENQDNL